MKKAVRLTISGRVQNVGFRHHTRKTAQKLGITGFVKNQSDGSVYAEAAGDEESLDQFILWCHSGPTWARVDDIKMQMMPFAEYAGFEVF